MTLFRTSCALRLRAWLSIGVAVAIVGACSGGAGRSVQTPVGTTSTATVETPEASRNPAPIPDLAPRTTALAISPRVSWKKLPLSPLSARAGAASVWTGREWLIWGGITPSDGYSDGASFDPRTNRWKRLPAAPLRARSTPVAFWAGSEMLIWDPLGRGGAAFRPGTQSWRRLPPLPLSPRSSVLFAWTGNSAIVLGGYGPTQGCCLKDGALFDINRSRWERIPPPTADSGDPWADVSVWTGHEFIVSDERGHGYAYSPKARQWRTFAFLVGNHAVWSDNLLVSFGREAAAGSARNEGGAGDPERKKPPELQAAGPGPADAGVFDPEHDTWNRLPRGIISDYEFPVAAVWTGSLLLLWGKSYPDSDPCKETFGCESGPGSAAALSIDAASWVSLPQPVLRARDKAAVAWTGRQLLVWGGWYDDFQYADGAALTL